MFSEWYNDIELYHYIGYLIYFGEKVSDLYDDWRKSKTRAEFDGKIKEKINAKIKSCKNLNQQYEYDESADGGNASGGQGNNPPKTVARPLLLLHNIQTVINQNKNFENKAEYGLRVYYKFPFHLFKKEAWDVEHIYPETENELTDEKQQREWLLSVYNSNVDESLKIEIKEFLDKKFSDAVGDERQEDFSAIYDDYMQAGEHADLLDEEERNRLWNFVLLDSGTNRSYGNAIFSVKRRFIIGKDQCKKWEYNAETFELEKVDNEKDKAGKSKNGTFSAFVPVCTKNVFMKFYTPAPNDLTDWTKQDAENYLENIKTVLKDGKFDIEFAEEEN